MEIGIKSTWKHFLSRFQGTFDIVSQKFDELCVQNEIDMKKRIQMDFHFIGLCEACLQPRLFKHSWLPGNLRIFPWREQVIIVKMLKYFKKNISFLQSLLANGVHLAKVLTHFQHRRCFRSHNSLTYITRSSSPSIQHQKLIT